MRTTFIIALMTCAASSHAQFKCVGPNGAVSFQQAPCAQKERQQALDFKALPPTSAGPSPESIAKANAAKNADLDKRLAIRAAIEERRPMVGMTIDELGQAMGTPTVENRAQYGTEMQDQLIWYRNGRTIYVYTKNGLVTSIQDVAGAPTQKKQGTCLNSRQIRDLEIEASTFYAKNNAALQLDLSRRIADAKTCP